MQNVRYLLAGVLLCLGVGVKADNIISISSAEGAPGDEVSISINLNSSDAIASLQVSIPLDENLTLVSGSGQLGSRCPEHSQKVGVNDGVLQVFVYSLSMTALSGNSGEVIKFKLKLGSQPSTINLTPSKVILTDTSGKETSGRAETGSVTVKAAKAEYSVQEVDFGQVPIRSSYNKSVTVSNTGNADLIISSMSFSDVNVFSTTTTLPLTVSPGASSQLNITYAPVERGNIERTLKVGSNSSSKLNTIKLKAQPFAVNELHVLPVSGISDEEVTISMTMNNMDDINGYQVELEMPEQLEFVSGSFVLSDRKQDHASAVSLNDGVLRIVVYSQADKPFTGNDGEIGSFKVKLKGRYSVELKPSKAVLSATINKVVENVLSEVYGGQVTISSPQVYSDSSLDFGAVPITEDAEKSFSIANYGSAPLTISRIMFDSDRFSVKESLPIIIEQRKSESLTVTYNSLEQTPVETTMWIYSNDPDQRIREVKVCGSRYAPNFLSAQVSDVFVGEELAIALSVSNYDVITGLQFDLTYPQGYEPYDDNHTLEPRAGEMTVTARKIGDRTFRYFCYYLSGGGIGTGEGKVMTLMLKPTSDTADEDSYTLSMKNIKMSTAELTDKYAGSDFETTFKAVMKGDAHYDKVINDMDVEEIANAIMGHASEYYNEKAADVNGDGVVNVADLTAVVNIILEAK